jgi:hypothetical protein
MNPETHAREGSPGGCANGLLPAVFPVLRDVSLTFGTGGGRGVGGGEGRNAPTMSKRRDVARDGGSAGASPQVSREPNARALPPPFPSAQ